MSDDQHEQPQRSAGSGQALPAYDPMATCRKCNGEDIATTYQPRGCVFPARCGVGTVLGSEHLDRYCRRCGFSWAEAVLPPLAGLDGAGQGRDEIEVYRQMIEGVLGVAFPPGYEPIVRLMRFVLKHRRMPTEAETFSEINCPALARLDGTGQGDGE